jgi:protein-disulfide isomerase
LLLAALAGGATCQNAVEPDDAAADSPDAGAAPVAAAPKDIPGVDLGKLSPSARRELDAVLTDEFCYCGGPHTLGTCLREHGACRHSRRLVALAARFAAQGLSSADISQVLSHSNQGFAEPRKKISVDPRMCEGAGPEAKITLVEFFDYECPFCAAVSPALRDFARKSSSQVRMCVVPFALASHANSIPAAQAALFARDAGKFWAMHDALLENQMGLSPDFIRGLATSLGLSADALGKAMAANKYDGEIQGYKEAGKAAGVDATPSLYLNGHKLELDLSEEVLGDAVDDELEWMANNGAWAPD